MIFDLIKRPIVRLAALAAAAVLLLAACTGVSAAKKAHVDPSGAAASASQAGQAFDTAAKQFEATPQGLVVMKKTASCAPAGDIEVTPVIGAPPKVTISVSAATYYLRHPSKLVDFYECAKGKLKGSMTATQQSTFDGCALHEGHADLKSHAAHPLEDLATVVVPGCYSQAMGTAASSTPTSSGSAQPTATAKATAAALAAQGVTTSSLALIV